MSSSSNFKTPLPMGEGLGVRLLKQYWGYDTFRGIQEDIINSITEGRDTLGLMPTGGGKSITFQVPALAKEGLCLVITPLIALMKDQVQNLKKRGIKALAIYSGMSRQEIIVTLENCIFGNFKFLYISPERLDTEIFRTKLQKMKISMITVDESHCISQWGYDFRPAYLKIAEIRTLLPGVPVLALTATATPEVVKDIQARLHFREENVFCMSFERKNLAYIVRKTENKTGELLHILRRMPGSAIIYVRNRRRTKEITELLHNEGITADFYHAGLDDATKDIRQQRWQTGESRVMVATNAFGMGIDKPDVRIVIHMDLPDSIEAYFQEAGRAGRDGEPSECILYYEPRDVRTNRLFIENGEENSELDEETRKIVKERDLDRLKQMTFYCFTSECLRQYILNYFGEKSSSYCGNCLNCQTQFEEVDITLEANTILRCLDALDWNYGAATVIDIVHSGKSQKILGKNLDKNPEYAVLSERTVPRLRQILRELQFREYVEEKGEQYPVICLTPEGKAFMKTEEPLIMKLPKEETEKKSESKEKKNRRKKGAVAAELSEKDAELFESLRELRREIASEEKVPPYMVFADKTLAGMCVMRPATRDEMLEVSGVGEHKLEKYGDRFLEILRKG